MTILDKLLEGNARRATHQPNVSLNLIKTFLKVYEHRSMSRAAESLFCSPAAISMRLKAIEDEIDGCLFSRHHHRLDPTDLGERLYWKANALMATYDDFLEAAVAPSEGSTIRIGVPDDYALSFIQRGLRNINVRSGDIKIDIVCDLSTHLDVAIQRQEIDVGLATLDYLPSSGTLVSKLDLNWIGDPNSLPDFNSAIPIAVYPEGCVFRRAMIEALEAEKVAWRIASQASTSSGVLAAVRAGLAITTMADGSVPGDLAVIQHCSLPRLRQIPIYLLRGPRSGEAVKSIEDAIIEQLHVSAATTFPG